MATQLGYTQRLLDAARYRIQMIGVPELTQTTIAPQPVAHLTTANWEQIPLPAPASQINDFSADPIDPESLLVCGISTLEKSPIQGEMTPSGPVWHLAYPRRWEDMEAEPGAASQGKLLLDESRARQFSAPHTPH